MIKHIVVSSGGPSGFIDFGILKYLFNQNYLNYNNIESLYGTSIGSLICCVMCLKLNIEIFENFLINRNWDKYINLSFSKLYYSLSNNHLIDEKFIYDFLKPLLLYSDLSENITLLEFYNVTKIDLHMFTVKISSDYMTQIDINYKSYPNLKLIKAIEMSCCIPLIFKTIIHNNDCYLDGGFLNSFPLNNCLKKHSNKNEVFAIKNLLINEKVQINEKSSVSVLINIIINKVLEKLDQKYKKINNMIIVNNDIVNNLYKNQSPSKVWLDSMNKKNTRKELVYQGEKLGQQYLKTRINELL